MNITRSWLASAGRLTSSVFGGRRCRAASWPSLWPALCLALSVLASAAFAAEPANPQVRSNLLYKSGAISAYETERCRLDYYLPAGSTGFATMVWFHGGALQGGNKEDSFNVRIAERFAQAGVATAMVNYRLSPKVKYPAYIDDAAAAFAWVKAHAAEMGGDPNRIFVGGHSAGGYLTFMLGLDPRYLRPYGLEPSAIAGLVPVSGQTMTHYSIREERGQDKNVIYADDAAPIHYASKTAPPMLIVYAEHDMAMRVEENLYLAAALKAAGATNVAQRLFADRDHGSVAGNIPQPGDPVAAAILEFIAHPERAGK